MQTGNLKQKYTKEIRNQLKSSLDKGNIYEVPRLTKIVVNTGFGKMSPDKNAREKINKNLMVITGQRPIFTTAKKAIAGFKTRKGQIIGAKITLRGERMYHFYEKLVNIVIPRLRDFRGMSEEAFDGKGNYSIGFREINLFPEIEYSRGEKAFGLQMVICTDAKNKEETMKLLASLGMVFTSKNDEKKKEIKEKALVEK